MALSPSWGWGGGSRAGGGRGPHSGVGRWWGGRGPNRCGSAAVPRAGRAGNVLGSSSPPPSPPPREGAVTKFRSNGTSRLTMGWPGGGGRGGRAQPPSPLHWLPCSLPPISFAHGTGTMWPTRPAARPRPRLRTRAPRPAPPTPLAPAVAPRPRPAAVVVQPGCPGVPRPQLAARVGQHHLCPCPPRRVVPWGPAPPGPPRRGVERVVAHPPRARRRPPLAVRRPGPHRPRVRDQGGHHRARAAMEVPPRPLCARPPPRRLERRSLLHVALVPGATVAGGDRRGRLAMAGWSVGTPPTAGTFARTAASPSSRGRRLPASPTPWRWTSGAGCGTTTPPASPPPPPRPLSLGDLAGGGRRGARPPPPAHRRLVGRPAGVGQGLGHRPVARRSPPRPPRPPSGPLAQGGPRGRSPRRGMGARLPPAHPPPPRAACRRQAASSPHAARSAAWCAYLGPVTSAAFPAPVQRARVAQEQ